MITLVSRTPYTDEEISSAVEFVKMRDPALWAQLVELERQQVPIKPIRPALVRC